MRVPIRVKLAAALALPLVALVGVAGYQVVRADAEAGEVAEDTDVALAATGPSSLIAGLQAERNLTFVQQLGLSTMVVMPTTSTTDVRAATDRTVGGRDEIAVGLRLLRDEVDGTTEPTGMSGAVTAGAVFDRYTAMIQPLVDGNDGLALTVDDAAVRTGVELVDLAARRYESAARVVRQILVPVLAGDTSLAPRLAAADVVADVVDQRAAMVALATGRYAGVVDGAGEERADAQIALLRTYLETGAVDIAQLGSVLSPAGDGGWTELQQSATSALRAEADRQSGDVGGQRRLTILLGAAMVAAAVLVIVLASRSITSPLRSLTRQARDVAASRLPDAVQEVLDTPPGEDVVVPAVPPVAVQTRDEVADVAAALNTVQTSALDLAVEQTVLRKHIADSFVQLGRRNQELVDRQLDLITDLEREEQEPERLESLFRLDHLATRMRRTAESLLRLAGAAPGATGDSGRAMPMVDVVRGALGEIEGYERVEVRALDPVLVDEVVGADLSHALAELVENALHFSPPDEPVRITGRFTADGGYVLGVADEGIGMSEEQLVVANRRLAGRESFTVAPSRYMGHYVAGQLASSLGVRIHLEQEPTAGITARIDLPVELIG